MKRWNAVISGEGRFRRGILDFHDIWLDPILCFVRLSPFQSVLVKPALIVDPSVFVLRIRK